MRSMLLPLRHFAQSLVRYLLDHPIALQLRKRELSSEREGVNFTEAAGQYDKSVIVAVPAGEYAQLNLDISLERQLPRRISSTTYFTFYDGTDS